MVNKPEQNTKSIVLKFGGTSVKDAEAMSRVVQITALESHFKKVVVTSACSGITDKLLAISNSCTAGNQEEAYKIFNEIKQHHWKVFSELKPIGMANMLGNTEQDLTEVLQELENLIRGAILLGEITLRTKDYFASFGERLSSILLSAAFAIKGHKTLLIDSRRVVITDENFTNAKPILSLIKEKALSEITSKISEYDVIVAQGFIGMSKGGITTTIGRGGSDHTGALLGAAIGAEEIQIWTDVSGILTADPRLVPQAKVVPEVTFSEARQLAYFGAKVIHPDTIVPAVEMNIPVIIKNSMKPEDPGTRILPDSAKIQPGIHSVTIKKDVIIFEIIFAGNLSNISGIFAEHKAEPECLISAENRCVVAIKAAEFSDELYTSLEEKYSVTVLRDTALVCLCGSDLTKHHGTIANAISSIDGRTIYFIASGFSQNAVLIGVRQNETTEILSAMHSTLFG